MIQSIPRKDTGGDLGRALGGGLQQGFNMGLERQYAQAQKQEEQSRLRAALGDAEKIYNDVSKTTAQKRIGLAQALQNYPEHAKQLTQPLNELELEETKNKGKPPAGGHLAQPVDPAMVAKIKQFIQANPDADSNTLALGLADLGVPPDIASPYVENARRTAESNARGFSEKSKETLDYRKEAAEKGESARAGIENKERLMELIDTGNLDDPSYAAIAESLPLNLGKRLLSPETVEYKAGLIEEFGDLRRLFQGQTRVKEIELLEQKIADIYLTDEQKKRILKSRVGALEADVLKADVTAEVERDLPNAGIGQFTKEVERRYKMALKQVADQTIDEQKAVIKEAEDRRKTPLDLNDPQSAEIVNQILKEAGGDPKKAEQIARKKGYKF